MASLRDLKTLADQYETNRRIVKAYGDEFKNLGLAEKEASSLAQKAAKLDEESLKKRTEGLKASKEGIKKVADVLGQARDMGKDAFSGLSSAIGSLSTGNVKGTIDGIVESVAALAKGLDLVYPGLGQAAAALVKFAGGGAGLMFDLASRTIDENQNLIEMRNTFDALGSNIGNTGDELVEFLGNLSRDLPQTRAQLAKMAEPLLEAGVQGDKLERSIRAQSAATAMLGDRGGQAYASLAQRARDAARQYQPLTVSLKDVLKTGINTKDLADAMGISQERLNTQIRWGAFNANQFGDALDVALTKKGEKASKSLMGTLGNILPKLTENISKLFQFSDDKMPGFAKFSDLFQKFANTFDEDTQSGKELKNLLHDIVDNVLAGAGNILHDARRGFKMLEIVITEVYIRSHPLRRALHGLNKELGKSGHHGITFKTALEAIGTAASVAVGSLTELVRLATKVAEVGNKIGQNRAAGAAGHALGSSALGAINPVLGVMHLLGHAQGGVVTGIHNGLATVQPAPGEGLASIGRGEQIMPAGRSESRGMNNVFHIAVTGAGSTGEALELTEEALALVLERARLRAGFG